MADAMDINFKRKVLEEIKGVLLGNNTNLEFNNKVSDPSYYYENDCVSLYDIKNVLSVKKKEIDELDSNFQILAKTKLEERFGGTHSCYVRDFEFEKEELIISFSRSVIYSSKKYVFSKKDGDLYIKEYEDGMLVPSDILFLLGKDILSLYNKKQAFYDYENQNKNSHKCVNSNFYFDCNNKEINIYFEEDIKQFFNKSFEVKYKVDSDRYVINANSYETVQFIYNNENKIFENIFVKIEDCPEWIHEYLKEIKSQKLNVPEEDKELDNYVESQPVQSVKQKSFISKLFPFRRK